MKHKKWTIFTPIIFIVCVGVLLYLKWPYTLSHYFEMDDTPNFAVVQRLHDREEMMELTLDDETAVTHLWDIICNTKIVAIGLYETVDITTATCYKVNILSKQEELYTGKCSFDYDDSGYVYIRNVKYRIVGSSQLSVYLSNGFGQRQ